jgi:RNA polymerase sigma-70 factor (ECF subfamily)
VRLCERLLQDREEGRDAAQEVFLRAFRKAQSIRPQGQLYTWLYRVAVNYCLNRLRRRRMVRFLRLEVGVEQEPFDPPSPEADAERALIARRDWRRLRQAIEVLPANQRLVLLLAKLEGLSYKEIALAVGISVGAVESRLVRAMRTLEREVRGASGVGRAEGR